MANIIIIESELKVRRQMEEMLLEINPDNKLASFNTTTEFEKAFLPTAPKHDAFKNHRFFEGMGFEQVRTILTHPISDSASFSMSTLTLTIDADMQNILDVSPLPTDGSTIFGFKPEELKGPAEKLSNMVPEAFRSIWKDAFSTAQKEKMASASIAIMSIEKKLSLLNIQWAIDSQKRFVLSIEDMNKVLRPIVLAEKTWREEQEKLALELKVFPTIDLIILRMDSGKDKPRAWFTKVKAEIRKRNMITEERGEVRVVLLKFEDDGVSKLDLLDPIIDDLIFLPLDRSLFLQKIDIVLALPKSASPRFLFNQAIEMTIEVSKLTKLEKLSDIALVIRNPTRLMNGMLGHFYFIFPNQKNIIEVFGKAFRSEPNPEHPGEYLVYFFFMGVKKNMLTQIRSYLSKAKGYHSLLTESKEKFEFNPDDLFASEEARRVREVVVVDFDQVNLQHLHQSITDEMDQVRVIKETSYISFLKKYLRNSAPGVVHSPVEPEELFAESIKFRIDPQTLNMMELLSPCKDEDLWFGYSCAELKTDLQGWKKPFRSPDQQERLAEAFQLAIIGNKHRTILEMHRQNGDIKLVGCLITQEPDGSLIFEYHVPTIEELNAFTGDSTPEGQLQKLDLIIVDVGFMGNNFAGWIEGLSAAARQKGVLAEKERLKIMVMVDEHQNIDLKRFSQPEIVGMIYKHGDLRSMLVQISNHIENKFTIYQINNAGWATANFNIHVAKDIQLEQISEFGVTIRLPRPMRPGTFLFMRKSIFDNAPNQCLAARFYACEESSKYPGEYQCSALYYGINDMFMKFARQWFRESYAQSKQKESSGGGGT